MTPQEILAKMTPGEWKLASAEPGMMIYIPRCNIAYGLTIEDAEAICLLHSDLMVKQRRGWWTELNSDGVWYIQAHALWTAVVKRKPAFDACTQVGTDLGLLTKAEAWAIKEGLVEAL